MPEDSNQPSRPFIKRDFMKICHNLERNFLFRNPFYTEGLKQKQALTKTFSEDISKPK